MRPLVLVKEIEQTSTGFIVRARWPYGDDASGYGPVICQTLDDVFDLIERCAVDAPRRADQHRTAAESPTYGHLFDPDSRGECIRCGLGSLAPLHGRQVKEP